MKKIFSSFIPCLAFLTMFMLAVSLILHMRFSYAFNLNDELNSNKCDLLNLEPPTPININSDDLEVSKGRFPNNTFSINDVIEKGKEIPFEFIYSNLNWERTIYKDYWHSSHGRWCYIPNRIYYAMHRIFATYNTGSVYYDFVHNLGIAEEQSDFATYYDNNAYNYIVIVVFQSEIMKVYTYRNQVVIVSKPQRTGLQAITLPIKYINNLDKDPNLLIQLATSSGEEVDFSTIILVNEKH